MEQTIREQLEALAEEKYRIFSSSLTPGKDNILGVRIPLLKKMAAKLTKGDWREYLAQAADDSMEEVMLQGMVIGNCKADIEEVLDYACGFIPKIDCWSVCDCFCSGLKIVKSHKKRVWEFIGPYLKSDKEYEIRFGVVMLLHYISEEYAPLAFAHFDRIEHEGYYVKMAVAWVLSMYYVKLPELTLEYLRSNELDDFTYNKALQKIVESLQVNQDIKTVIRSMKRKKPANLDVKNS
ncbi:MAG: DNA alkylation repair protein [Herbinix sp.]|nr:DNA alkylation repair protein [Herbinix sp.]